MSYEVDHFYQLLLIHRTSSSTSTGGLIPSDDCSTLSSDAEHILKYKNILLSLQFFLRMPLKIKNTIKMRLELIKSSLNKLNVNWR